MVLLHIMIIDYEVLYEGYISVKKKKKQLLLDILIMFGIHFSLLFLYQVYTDYRYYSVYNAEILAEFFHILEALIRNVFLSLFWGIPQTVVSAFVLILLSKTNINNICKILLTWCITSIIVVIWLLRNMKFTF